MCQVVMSVCFEFQAIYMAYKEDSSGLCVYTYMDVSVCAYDKCIIVTSGKKAFEVIYSIGK